MKIALIHPRYNRGGAEPLGLLYLASVLRQNGWDDQKGEFRYFDGSYAPSAQTTIEQLKEYKPDILCFTVHTIYTEDCRTITNWFRSFNPKGIVIAGGPHPTVLPRETLKEFADIAVIGEAELTFPELVRKIDDLSAVRGIAFRSRDGPIINPPRDPIPNLDTVPFPARDLLEQRFFDIGQLTLVGSRGCPFSCAYCQDTLNQLFGLRFRQRSPKNVADELDAAVQLFKDRGSAVSDFVFTDDGITYRRDWIRGVSDEFIARGNTISWMGDSRADTVPDDDTLQLMRRAGCTKMALGVESGNDYIRNVVLKKEVKREEIVTAFQRLWAADIQPHAFLMVGSPGETMASVYDTLFLLDEIKPASAQVSVTTPLPATGLHDMAMEQNLITAARWSDYDYYYESHLKLDHFTKEQIERVRNAMKYAVVFRAFFHNYVGREVKYSTLFRLFYKKGLNQTVQSMERGRTAPLRRAVQSAMGIKLQRI